MDDLVLDHVFVFASPGAPEAAPLLDAGLRPGRERRHEGQGTANRCFFFADAMLELIWIDDQNAARSPPVQPLFLWERSQWRSTGLSPFGICLRTRADEPERLPFATRAYRPSYLPPGAAIRVATELPPLVPLLFAVASRWDPPDCEHALSGAHLSRCTWSATAADVVGPELRAALPPVLVQRAEPRHLMELELDGGRGGGAVDLRPALPLVLRW